MQVEPYLFFDGRGEEALEFYRQALGAEVTAVMRYRESPEPEMVPAGAEDKIMHAVFRVGESTVMVSDDCTGHPTFQGFSLALSVTEPAEAERLFSALADRGQVQMPLAKTFWSPLFGMVTDRFGVSWMINVFTPGS
jgi:PhnB protein